MMMIVIIILTVVSMLAIIKYLCSEKSDKGEHPPPEPRQESSSCEDHMGQVGSGADGGGDYQAITFEHDVVERLKIA